MPRFASTNPTTPATIAQHPITTSKTNIGFTSDLAVLFGRDPARAANAIKIPSGNPTHHVARTPHPSPSNIGESV